MIIATSQGSALRRPDSSVRSHLRFDNESGVFYDLTGKTVTNSRGVIQASPGKFIGKSAYFNGSNHLFVSHETDFDFGANAFEIKLWAWPTSGDGTIRDMVGTVSSNGCDLAFRLRLTAANVFQAYLFSGSNILVTGTTVTSLNTFYHVKLLKTGTTCYLFVNGTSEGTPAAVTTIHNSPIDGYVIGKSGLYTVSSNPFTGYIDEVEINALTNPSTANFVRPTRRK